MKTYLRAMTIGLIVMVCALTATASQSTMIQADGSMIIDLPQPYHNPFGELDRTWPDSMYHYLYDGQGGMLIVVENYWSGTRFTPPDLFTLQGVRFLPLNQGDNFVDECRVYIMLDDTGSPGEILNNGEPVWSGVLPELFEWVEIDFEELEVDFMQFDEAQDFWIVYGPAPGGTYPELGWWNLAERDPSDPMRSFYCANGIHGEYIDIDGDLYIVAEGEFAGNIEPAINLPDTEYNFGNVAVGHTSTVGIVVENTGISNVTIESFELDEEDNLSTIFNFPMILESGGEIVIPVMWSPEVTGNLFSRAVLSHNDPLVPNPLMIEFDGHAEESPTHFVPVDPTGLPYAVIVDDILINGDAIEEGDEVGVFDGDLCVGIGIYEGEYPIAMTVWEENFDMPGFVEGNPMAFSAYSYDNDMEYDNLNFEIVDEHGNGLFGEGPFTEVNLWYGELPEDDGYPFEPVRPTGRPYAIVVDEASIEGVPLEIGDEIGLFDGNLCVGAYVLEDPEGPYPLTGWGRLDEDRPETGFTPGNPIIYKIYSHHLETLVTDIEADYGTGDGMWETGPYSVVVLDGTVNFGTLGIDLEPNRFELISTNRQPINGNLVNLLEDIVDNILVIYEDDGSVFIPELVNNIVEIDATEGLKVLVDAPSLWTITGAPFGHDTEYSLTANQWNWLGYPFKHSVPVEIALGDYSDQLIIVMNDDAHFWIPDQVNNLNNMIPGEGYYVYPIDDIILTYDDIQIASSLIEREPILTLPGSPAPTGMPYLVRIQFSGDTQASVVELYDGATLVGKGLVNHDRLLTDVIAWQGDDTFAISGFTPGNSINMKLYDSEGRQLPGSVNEARYGEGPYATLAATVAELPGEFVVEQGYPNPFNPSVTVPFQLPEEGLIQISVFNMLGQEVFVLERSYEPGSHHFVFDADRDGHELVSGLYILQVKYSGQSHAQKIMLMK
ncbi:T9SS type A sorting domain-containing protein [bacterium]|nr:T9SS type A sorting domain-containing protein [bacterium]